MLPTVAILLPAEEARAPHVRAMEEACTSAAPREAHCQVVEAGSPLGETLAVATIIWLDRERRTALVQVRLGSESARERRVEFAPSDPERERWRAVGFAVATLVGERIEEGPLPPELLGPSASASPPGSAPPPVSSAPSPSVSSIAPVGSAEPSSSAPPPALPPSSGGTRPLFAGVTVGAVAGMGGALLGTVEGHGGVGVTAGWDLSLAAGTTVLGGGAPEQVKSSFTWVAAGIRPTLWAGRSLRSYLRVELLLEGASFEARRGVYRDSLTRWRPGGRAGLDLEFELTSWLSLEARAELGLRSGSLTVIVASTEQGQVSVLRPAMGLGIISRF